MNLFRYFRRRSADLSQKLDALESRIHHLEVVNRDLLARVGSAEADLAWICRPDEQPLPAASELPEGVVYHHKK